MAEILRQHEHEQGITQARIAKFNDGSMMIFATTPGDVVRFGQRTHKYIDAGVPRPGELGNEILIAGREKGGELLTLVVDSEHMTGRIAHPDGRKEWFAVPSGADWVQAMLDRPIVIGESDDKGLGMTIELVGRPYGSAGSYIPGVEWTKQENLFLRAQKAKRRLRKSGALPDPVYSF